MTQKSLYTALFVIGLPILWFAAPISVRSPPSLRHRMLTVLLCAHVDFLLARWMLLYRCSRTCGAHGAWRGERVRERADCLRWSGFARGRVPSEGVEERRSRTS